MKQKYSTCFFTYFVAFDENEMRLPIHVQYPPREFALAQRHTVAVLAEAPQSWSSQVMLD